jgi:hypothetical protein
MKKSELLQLMKAAEASAALWAAVYRARLDPDGYVFWQMRPTADPADYFDKLARAVRNHLLEAHGITPPRGPSSGPPPGEHAPSGATVIDFGRWRSAG